MKLRQLGASFFIFMLMVSPAAAELNDEAEEMARSGLMIEKLDDAFNLPDIKTLQREYEGRRSDAAFHITAPLR